MVGDTSNIYVSISHAHGASGSEDQKVYRKPSHKWMISVERHHFHMPGTPKHEAEPVHYGPARDPDSGAYTVQTHPPEPGIIGNILIAESVHASPEQIHQYLSGNKGSSASSTTSDHVSGDGSDEHWMRRAIRELEEQKLAESFKVDEFMTFAHGYLANRLDGEGPALIAYPKIHDDHEKKSSKFKFWVSRPMESRTKRNKAGEATVYGGLM